MTNLDREVTPRFKEPPKPKKRKPLPKNARPMVNCDTLFGLIVRSRPGCEIRCASKCPSGAMQAAHGFSRRYRPVRWDDRNCFKACQGCHLWMTLHPLEWDDWLVSHWGQPLYDELRHLALHGPKVDVKATQAALEQRWAAINGRAG